MPKRKKSQPAETYLTIEQLMARLDIRTRATIHLWVRQGKLHPVRNVLGKGKGGRRVFYQESEVTALEADADLITVAEAAALLDCSTRQVDRLADKGLLEKTTLQVGRGRGGSRVRVSRRQVMTLKRTLVS